MAKITKPHHTGFTVRSIDRSIAFYRDLLGFELVFQWNPQAPYIGELVGYPTVDLHGAILRVPGSDVFLELLEYRNIPEKSVDMANGNIGNGHIAFYVDELAAALREAEGGRRRQCLAAGDADDRAEPRRQGGLHDRPRRLPRRTDRDDALLRRLQEQSAGGSRERRMRRGAAGGAVLPPAPAGPSMTALERQATRKRVTIRDVAALADVDVSLVSRVLNDHPKASAAAATRTRILEAARSLGYQPNVVARGLRMARTWTLGLMLPNLTNPMYAEIIRAAEERARERGFGLVFGTHVDGEGEATFARLLQQGRVDGLLTASGVHGDAFLRRVAHGGFGPVVMLNRRVRGVQPTVTVDDAAGAALAVRHFAELGHRVVAGIFGPATIETSRRRRSGFLGAARRAGIEAIPIDEPGVDAADRQRRGRADFSRLPARHRDLRLDLRHRHGRVARRPPRRRPHPAGHVAGRSPRQRTRRLPRARP